MKNTLIKYASALLVASTLFAAVDTATAGGKNSKSNKDCGDSRGGRDEHQGRGGRDDRDDRDCSKPPTPTPVPVSGSVAMTPTGSIVVSGNSVQVSVAYTAPANSSAVLNLLQDNVVVATVSIPGATTSGSVAFTADISSIPVNSATVLQAQLSFTSASASGGDDEDDDCDRDHHRRRGCDRERGHGDDDDDDCSGGSGGTTTTSLLSDTLTVLRSNGGGQSG